MGLAQDDIVITEIKRKLRDILAFEDLHQVTISSLCDRLSKELECEISPLIDQIRECVLQQLQERAELELQVSDDSPNDATSISSKSGVESNKKKKRPVSKGNTAKASGEQKKGKREVESARRRKVAETETKTSTVKKKKKTTENKNNPFSKPLLLSEPLKALLKIDKIPRYEITKRLWVYIKEHQLQDPNNGRLILCDEALKVIFGKDSIDSFQLPRCISRHVSKIEEEENSSKVDAAASDDHFKAIASDLDVDIDNEESEDD